MANVGKARLNRKLAVILLLVVVVGGVGVAAAHRVQRRIGIENARQTGMRAAEDGNWERAVGNLKYYLNAEPSDAEALKACATALVDGYTSRAEAYELLERVLEIRPADVAARKQQVELALVLGWSEPARSHVTTLLQQMPDDSEALYLAGKCEEAAARPTEAVSLYERATKANPLHVGANQRLASFYAAATEHSAKAHLAIARLQESGDESTETLKTLAEYHARQQQFDSAYSLICRAAESTQTDDAILLLGARLATRKASEELSAGSSQTAVETADLWQPRLEAAIKSQPDASWPAVSLVMLQRASGQEDAALKSLRGVIERVPEQLELQFQLAWQLIELKRIDEAEQEIAELPENEIGTKYRRLLQGLVAVQRERWESARETLQESIEAGVEPAVTELEVMLQHVACCVQLGDWQAVTSACEELLTKYPGHRLARITLAFSRLANGDYQQAVLDLRQVDGLHILLSESFDTSAGRASFSSLRFQLPTDAVLKALNGPDRRRERAFLSALAAVCRGEMQAAQTQLAALGESALEERLFDLVSVSSNRRAISIDELQSVVDADPEDSRAISALFAAWANEGASAKIDAFVRDRLTNLNSDTWARRALVLGTACSNSSRMLEAAHPQLGASLSRYAETLFRKAADIDDSTSWQLVSFLAAHDQGDEALKLCRKAWSTNPGMIARLWMTQAQTHSDPNSELQELTRQIAQTLRPATGSQQPAYPALSLSPKDEVQLRLVLGDLSLMGLRYAQAEAEYGHVLQIDPDNVTAANNLAWLLAMRGHDLDRALDLAAHAISVDGRGANLLDTRACVYLARGEELLALDDLNEAARQARSADVEFHRAVAFNRQGQKVAAAESLRRAEDLGFDLHQRPPLEHPMCLELRDLWSELVATRLP